MTDTSRFSAALIVAALAIGAGVAGGGYFVSRTMVNAALIDTAEVKGLAERAVTADQAIWQISFKVSNLDVKAGYAEAEANSRAIRAFLIANGFPEAALLAGQTAVAENEFRDGNGQLIEKRYDITSSVIVSSKDVRLVDAANQKVGELIAQGLLLIETQPRYIFSGLNAIKPDMLREATQQARAAADEFAKNAGVNVGAIRTAAQGGFEVRDTNTGDYGTDDRSIEKQIRVVVTATFYLK